MIRAVIIDDIEIHRKELAKIINTYFADRIDLLGEAENFSNSITLIRAVKPDLVFLDVEILPDGTGFDLLRVLGFDNINFGIIFTTQYESYATRAFQAAAIDFLLKPVDPDKLEFSIQKYLKIPGFNISQFEVGFKQLTDPQNQNSKIVLIVKGQPVDIFCKNIIRCEAAGGYCHYFLVNSICEKITATNSLKNEAEKLSNYSFFIRVDKSHLINLHHIRRVKYIGEGGNVEMIDSSIVKVSKRKRKEFKKAYLKFKIKNSISRFGNFFK